MFINYILSESLILLGGFLTLLLDFFNVKNLFKKQTAVGSFILAIVLIASLAYHSAEEFESNFTVYNGFTFMVQTFNIAVSFLIIFLFYICKKSYQKHNSNIITFFLFLLFSLNFMLFATDLIILYMLAEMHAICFIFLILNIDNTKENHKSMVQYSILNLILSALLVLGVMLIYYNTGTFNIRDLIYFTKYNRTMLFIGLLIYTIIFLLKVSSIPFYILKKGNEAKNLSLPIVSVILGIQLFTVMIVFMRLSNIMTTIYENLKFIFPILVFVSTVYSGMRLICKEENSLIKGLFFISMLESNFIFANLFLVRNSYIGTAILGLMALCITNLGILYCIHLYSRKNLAVTENFFLYIENLRGLGQENPILSLCFTVLLLSFAGIPSTAIFFVIADTVQNFMSEGYYMLLPILLLSCHIVLVFYVGKIIYYIYCRKLGRITFSKKFDLAYIIVCCIIILNLFFFFYKTPVYSIINASIQNI